MELLSVVGWSCWVWWDGVVECGRVELLSVVSCSCHVWWDGVVECGEMELLSVVGWSCSVWWDWVCWATVVVCGEIELSVMRLSCWVWWDCGEMETLNVMRQSCWIIDVCENCEWTPVDLYWKLVVFKDDLHKCFSDWLIISGTKCICSVLYCRK